MFAVEIPGIYFYARFPKARAARAERGSERDVAAVSPQELICTTLAGMLPSSAAEIAEATGLDAATAAACLDGLSARCRVMFNPLTKRYSLPKPRPSLGLAA